MNSERINVREIDLSVYSTNRNKSECKQQVQNEKENVILIGEVCFVFFFFHLINDI